MFSRQRSRILPNALGRLAVALAPRAAGQLVRAELPQATPEQRAAAVAHVRGAVLGMPDLLRCGVGVAAVGYLVTRRLPWLRHQDLPVVTEFVRMVRGLGLAGAHEREVR